MAMRTLAQVMKRNATVATTVMRSGESYVVPHRCYDINRIDEIADVAERCQGEEDIENSHEGEHRTEIDTKPDKIELAHHVYKGGNKEKQHQPQGCQEGAQHPRHSKGIERGVEIEVLPGLKGIELHGAVEHSRTSQCEIEQQRIGTTDVIDVGQRHVAQKTVSARPSLAVAAVGHHTHGDDGHEEKHKRQSYATMHVAEVHDGHADGITRSDIAQEITLMHPSKATGIAN